LSLEGERLSLATPAKINLGLRIVGRREDGYHLIESVFVPISIFDDLTLTWRSGPDRVAFALEVDPAAHLPPGLANVTAGPDNLVVRAAEAFRSVGPRAGTLHIELRKRIPSGAGLGGGSSDAGAVLAGLATLAGDAAPPTDELASLALGLGADVPYFLSPRPARVTGIGERIEPLGTDPGLPLVLANPGISVATAEVYRLTAERGDSLTDSEAGSTMRPLSELCAEIESRPSSLGELLSNDLEPAATRLCPPVGRLLRGLRETGARGVGMSGSGGTVFGVYESMAQAERAAQQLLGKSETATIERTEGATRFERGTVADEGVAGAEGNSPEEGSREKGRPAWVQVATTLPGSSLNG
jgi:4-diphosphocytidyl-2-C-methyl-D-erythritol kinase